ncbi:MAG: undecaprenyl/decaprenyl-phosphate alpha-N-acetylglucosaminyl 1-phosphate transferase [Ruminococcaceae bacterium]|nr:undecaprenyl/decaprenyl-phosphate alpha-N-acetylglucosaminyl 1-phosphate transferase [Oscillospiraceae bacterium]
MACVMPEFCFMHTFTVFVLSFALTFCSVLPVKKTAFSVGALDVPKDKRRMHRETVARGGGLSIFFAFLAASLFALTEYGGGISTLGGALLSGGAIIVGVGLCDDVLRLSAKVKLLCQASVAFIPVAFGLNIRSPLLSEGGALFRIASYAFTLLFTVLLMNALNFIDGLDGLAAGFSFLASLSLFVCNTLSKNYENAFFCIALCGSALGFLPYNRHKAKIFMGDCGSLFFGYSLATLGIATLSSVSTETGQNSFLPLLPLLLIFAYPLCDLFFAVARRLYNRQSIFSPDARHFHHRLIARGFSHTESVRILLCAASLFCALGVLVCILFLYFSWNSTR